MYDMVTGVGRFWTLNDFTRNPKSDNHNFLVSVLRFILAVHHWFIIRNEMDPTPKDEEEEDKSQTEDDEFYNRQWNSLLFLFIHIPLHQFEQKRRWNVMIDETLLHIPLLRLVNHSRSQFNCGSSCWSTFSIFIAHSTELHKCTSINGIHQKDFKWQIFVIYFKDFIFCIC